MVCKECGGRGFTLEADYNHDVMMKVECMSCKAEQAFLDFLEQEVRDVLVNCSIQKLAETVATAIIRSNEDNTDRIQMLTQTKNIPALLAYVG